MSTLTIACNFAGSARHYHDVVVMPGARKRAIGSTRDAALVSHAHANIALFEAITGAEFLGEGAAKTAYLLNGTVYKVPNNYCDCGDDQCNGGDDYQSHQEFEVANGGGMRYTSEGWVQRPATKRPYWASPTSMYIVDGIAIVAQPPVTPADNIDYMDPRYSSAREQLSRANLRSFMADMHPGNYGLARNGHLRVFDLGA